MNRNIWNDEQICKGFSQGERWEIKANPEDLVPYKEQGIMREATDDDLMNLCGKKPILAKKSENEERMIGILKNISAILTSLEYDLNLDTYELDRQAMDWVFYCRDIAIKTIEEVEGKDE